MFYFKSFVHVDVEIYFKNLFTPRYSWNTAKVGVKHQSINLQPTDW